MAYKKSNGYITIAIIAIFAFLLVASSASAFEGCTDTSGNSIENYTNRTGNWALNQSLLCYNFHPYVAGSITSDNSTVSVSFINVTIFVEGNITINGTIILDNTNLTMNSTANNKTDILLRNSSIFSVTNGSNVTTNNTNAGYNLRVGEDATIYLNGSYIEYFANGTEAGFQSNGTVWMNNTTVKHSLGFALNASNGTINISDTYFFNNLNGLLINQTPITLVNSNISSTTNTYNILSWQQNITVNNTTVANVTAGTNGTNITVSWPVRFLINNTEGIAEHVNNLTDATVKMTSSAGSGFENLSLTTTNGTTATTFFTEYVVQGNLTSIERSLLMNYTPYTINVTSSKGNWSSNTSNFTYAMDTLFDELNCINRSVFDYYNNVSMTNTSYNLNATAGSFANVSIVVNNTGNGAFTENWDVINMSSNASSLGWTISFSNSSFNLTNETNQTVVARINVPDTAQPGFNYTFNITAVSGGRGGIQTIAWFHVFMHINNTTSSDGADYGRSSQKASVWLGLNHSISMGFFGSNSTYDTALALWAYNLTHLSNTSTSTQSVIINNTTLWLNQTRELGTDNYFWLDDGGRDGNITTALVLMAMRENGYSETPSQLNNFIDLSSTVGYLENQSNQSESELCWPNMSSTGRPCDAQNTSIVLAALLKSTSYNSTLTTNATAWLKSNQSNDGSWNDNINDTAWAIFALATAGDTTQNTTNGTTWLKDQQNISGHFGSDINIFETALTVMALQAAGATTWTVDVDRNSDTTADRYAGSVKYALDWMLTKQVAAGSWGSSSVNVTALGLLGISNYGSITGNLTGYAAAANYSRIPNATIKLTSGGVDYSSTSNAEGEFIINAPAGTYALTINHTLFETNNTNTSLVISRGLNITENFGLRPELTSVGTNSNERFLNLNGSTLNSGLSYTINGNCSYLFNLTHIEQDFTVNVTNSVGSESTQFYHATIATDVNGTFSFAGTTPTAPDAYVVNITCEDHNGSAFSNTFSLDISSSGSDDDAGGSGVTGGSGGSGADYSMAVTSYDSQVSVIQGRTAKTSFTIKNNGKKTLEGVKLEVIGIPSSWYTLKVSTTGLATEDLTPGESVTFDLTFNPPADAEPKSYTITLKAKDKDGLSIAEKKVTFKVTKVWDTAKIAELNTNIEDIKADLSDATADVKVLTAKGIATDEMKTDLEAFSAAIKNAIEKYNSGDYTESEQYYNEAMELLEKIKSAVAAVDKPPGRIGKWLSSLSLGIVSIFVIILLVGGFVGFIVWYKMFRVIPVSEIEKDADLFSEGARVEGVVKSITETKKGKVFLIQDPTGKLHVRYPFYTTVEKGHLIRATGAVKKYKDVPYMDAQDLHRVTVKHMGGFRKKGGLHRTGGILSSVKGLVSRKK